jgi:uncharacterized protein with von Willebrand factor type A (vWA) domain
MQRTMEDFLRALRAADVRVSPVEAIDAARTVEVVGYADRQLFKDALCATLAKTREEVDRFDATFETFFARERLDAHTARPLAQGEAMPEAVGQSELANMLLSGDAAGLAQAMEAAAEQVGVAQIRFFTQRSRLTRRMLDAMGLAQIEKIIAAAKASGRNRDVAGRLDQARRDLAAQAKRYVERQHELYAAGAGQALREEMLAQQSLSTGVDPRDFALMQQLVRKMARKLAERYSRRRKRFRRGQLDIRKTLRRSMPHEGVPFEIVWKSKKVAKPSIVAICDVSKSVAATAQFLLTFLYSLNEVVDRLDAFAFSSRLISVNDILDEQGIEHAIAKVLSKIGFRSTDYGAALEDFCEQHLDRLDRHTTVIILGDGRSNHQDPRMDLMQQIQQRCRAVIWLNPEPQGFWGQGDSEMDRYARFCHVAKECSTLADLERVIEDVLRKYVPN